MLLLEKHLMLLLKGCPNIILLFDKDGRIVFCTDIFLRLAKIDHFDSIRGLPFVELYAMIGDNEFVGGAIQAFQTIQKEHRTLTEYRRITFANDGKNRSFTVQSTPIYDDGSFEGVFAFFHDTTSIRDDESDERTRVMLDATPLACSFWDQDRRLIDCNWEAVRLLGLQQKSDFIEHFAELNPEFQPDGEPTMEKVGRLIAAAFETGGQRFEWMFLTKTGEPLPVETTLVRVPWQDSYRIAAYSRDLREIKANEQKMQEASERNRELEIQKLTAEASVRAKSEFLANMSHEIRTPMNAILGMTHLALQTEVTAKQRQYLENAEVSAQLLLRIINDILDFSKIEAGKLAMENQEFTIDDVLNNLETILGPVAAKKDLRLELSRSNTLPQRMMGDSVRLQQILVNLLNNAIKFTEKGNVTLNIQLDRRFKHDNHSVMLLFSILDTGIGMTQEQVSKLFRPFNQADSSTTRKYGGTGLGLVICKSIIELMDGSIWCNSVAGQGTTFYFTACFGIAVKKTLKFQLSPTVVEPASSSQTSIIPPEIFGARILLAEDNLINQMVASELLTSKGFVIDIVNNGQAAVEKVEQNDYDIVLMDIQMPEMDGLEATRLIRANPKFASLPILAMTAHAMSGDRDLSLEAGMNDHITKPIDPKNLYQILVKWLKNKGSNKGSDAPRTE